MRATRAAMLYSISGSSVTWLCRAFRPLLIPAFLHRFISATISIHGGYILSDLGQELAL